MKNLLIFAITTISLVACHHFDKNVGQLSDEQRRDALKDSSHYTTVQWLDSTYRDYGKTKEGEVLEVSYHFRNTGTHNLVVADVRPGCGCTLAEKPEEPIAPGKEGVIKAKFNTKGQHIGENRKYITVTANTTPSQTTELSFSAEVTN